VGDQYFNTVNNETRIYNGSAWQSAAIVGGTVANLTVNNDSFHNGVRVGRGLGSVATNTAVGASALAANTTAARNTGMGYQALLGVTSGGSNTSIGYNTLRLNNAGSANTAVGESALESNTASFNSAFGKDALSANTTGAYNTALGYQSGVLLTTGSKNTILGAYNGNQAGLDIRTANNYIVLSDGDGNPRLVSPGSANWSLGTPVSGVTWRSDSPTLILPFGGLRAEQYSIGNTQVKLTNNVYEASDTSYKYITSDVGSMYIQIGGVHKWECAPSGTAGGAVAFTSVLQTQLDRSVALQGAVLHAGTGITFPATQNASSNANTLDDYEEGSWTIGLRGSTTAGSYTVTGSCKYTKVGNVVTVTASIDALTVNSAGAGYAQITGLPFTKATGGLPQGAAYLNYVAFPSGTDYLTFSPITGAATDTWYFAGVKSGTLSANVDVTSFTGSTTGYFSATYFAST
jgi:hypothetical protein